MKIGSIVTHTVYGRGTVIELIDDANIKVNFQIVGVKEVLAADLTETLLS